MRGFVLILAVVAEPWMAYRKFVAHAGLGICKAGEGRALEVRAWYGPERVLGISERRCAGGIALQFDESGVARGCVSCREACLKVARPKPVG